MKLLVIRHAIAGDRDEWALTGEPDDKRPLTDKGRDRMQDNVRGLSRVVGHIEVLATSPLTRAMETAEIVADRFGASPVVREELVPERPVSSLLSWLQELGDADVVAVVGHEPHLSTLVSWLLTGRELQVLELKKGAACMLEFNGQPAPQNAKLLWALTPKALRKLGK